MRYEERTPEVPPAWANTFIVDMNSDNCILVLITPNLTHDDSYISGLPKYLHTCTRAGSIMFADMAAGEFSMLVNQQI